ncbi:PREDICTED: proteinase-activated receptor 3-like [Nanorana parkeri]|uniref:proteinase-activated receptor 3-like n=1 Tax=Nanorana parkeri TaxID=125878 RepID=UPI0008542D75|nr:PREDICTED: proteinase-activated receptor 3-like [Nanorana parkeri]
MKTSVITPVQGDDACLLEQFTTKQMATDNKPHCRQIQVWYQHGLNGIPYSAIVTQPKGRVLLLDNCNSSVLDANIKYHLTSSVTVLVVPTFYAIVFLLGLPANGIAFWVLLFKSKKMPSTLLLINLAAADLFFLLALPFKIVYHFLGNNWIFGETMCQLVTAVFYGNMYCSVFFLMAISIDRYFALVHPFLARSLRGWRSFASVATGIWLVVIAGVSIFFLVPQIKTFTDPNMTTCHDVWAVCYGYEWYTTYFLVLFIVGYAIPLIIIFICYVSIWFTLSRNRGSHSQVMRLIILVVFMFIICFTPSNILLIFHYLETQWDCHNQLYIWYMVAFCLTSFNSCIDPFIYYYMSEDCRQMVKDTLGWSSSGDKESVDCTKRTKLTSEMGRIST